MLNKTIILILFGALLAVLYVQFPYALKTSDDKANLIYSSLIAIALILGLKSSSLSFATFFRYAILWITIATVLLLSYSFKEQLHSALIPNNPTVQEDGSFFIAASRDNHFHIEVTMNNRALDCVVDTGATVIVIDLKDAKSLGIDLDSLTFNIPNETANGLVYAARVIIPLLKVGNIQLHDESIFINNTQMGSCLLGMSFLSKQRKISIEGNKMTISPR